MADVGVLAGLLRFPANVYRFRGLVRAIVVRELAGRFTGTLLGPAWLLIPSVFMIFIFTVVFSQVMLARLPGNQGAFAYSIHLCAGMLVWVPFLEAFQRARNVFIDHANLIKKNAFPLPVLFVPVGLLAFVSFALLAIAFAGFMGVTGQGAWGAFGVFGLHAILAILFGLALGAAFAVLNVFFRDVGQFTDLAAQLLFWATPIVYPASVLPPGIREFLALNPLYPLVQTSQQFALGAPHAAPSGYLAVLLSLAGALVAGILLYRRARPDLLDRL